MIKVSDVNKKFGDLEVLKGVNLSISAGEIVSIMGKSGAGKSTLLHIIGTLSNPDSGNVFINDQDVFNLSSNDLATFRNETIGFIFQFHHLLPEFTALENVFIPGLIAKKSKAESSKKAKELLDYLGLSERLEHKPNELSGGEQQRVAIARALLNDPKVILADEPTGNLDTGTSSELHQLILQLRKDFGQTFVIVTHNSDIDKISDRCIYMEDGGIKKTSV